MNQPDSSKGSVPPASPRERRTLLGIDVIKWVFALEYALQGLANPFQGITYQPFFRHFRVDYGMSEAATQKLFAKAYLAWSMKPVIGFLIDAYGRTRTLLLGLLTAGTLGYLLTPLVDRGVLVFFGSMFLLSVAFAATDVAVDRATVIVGEEESRATGRSKSTTVGLNQAICWTAVYGTGAIAAVLGGYVADHIPFDLFLASLAIVPALVLLVVYRLPRDRAQPIPIKQSVLSFWNGLNSGPVLGVMFFFFLFKFQPAMGPLWNDHLIKNLKFSQTEIGLSDGTAYAGYFLGVLVFAWKGVKWQDRYGLKRLFRIYIFASILLSLTQYLFVEPWFTAVTAQLAHAFPSLAPSTVRLSYLCVYNFALSIIASVVQMSTFSLVGAVIPVAAAGSLFAGFMSVANLAYSFSYSSGAWLYTHGPEWSWLRSLDQRLFHTNLAELKHLSISMLLLINSLAFLLSFLCVHLLPNQRETAATERDAPSHPGSERWLHLPPTGLRLVNILCLAFGAGLWLLAAFGWGLDAISALLISFFSVTFLRKQLLDAWLRRLENS